MLKKIYLFIFISLLVFLPLFLAKTFAQTNQQEVIVFVREGCKHCEDEEAFLDDLVETRDGILVTKYRLENANERKVWEEFTDRLQISKVTPITVVGNEYLIGFDQAETTGEEIVSLIEKAQNEGIKTDLNKVSGETARSPNSVCTEDVPCTLDGESQPFYLTLPFIGKIDAQSYSLLGLSALLGFIDGFNPCAMWVLVTFLIILLQLGNRRKMFIFAGTFILAEAIMYSLILTVWYKTWDFIRLDNIITPIVGVIAIAGGIFFIREWRRKELECRVANPAQRAKIRQRVEELAIAKFTFGTFLAVMALAFSVNIIEFACSIGIPQAFTKILELNQLSFWKTGTYIATYILFYMVDDLIVFALALWGAEKLALTNKYSMYTNLVGGILMLIIGLLLIFKPDLLLF